MSSIKTESAAVTTVTTSSTKITNSSYYSSNNSTMAESAFQQPVNMSTTSNSSLGSLGSSGISVSTSSLASPLAGATLTSSGSSASLSASASSTSSATLSSTTTTTRNNISVTNIKCEKDDVSSPNGNIVPVIATHGINYYNGITGNIGSNSNGISSNGSTVVTGGVRIPVPKAEDSDSEAELTNIENLKVRRRTPASSAMDSDNIGHSKNGPRPMSWEGELSESETNETEFMETENSLSNGPMNISSNSNICNVGIAVIKSEATTTTPIGSENRRSHHHHHHHLHGLSGSTHSIKSELEQISVDMHNAAIYASPHSKLKLGPTQSDPINLKYEPQDLASVNSPLLARSKTTNLPLPANPSPDSAIHSVYTHSSPSQSPLTSRHAPYTPSLSRNNSDASHSSCYSYSSEFSPTHSPIQGRHAPPTTPSNMYGTFNGAGVPQNMLYRPLAVDGGITSNSEAQNLTLDTKPLFSVGSGGDNGLPSSPAGISRQQLINSPCPICGDKISGFHYGIFSCESCKGFFKRTVQNRKNYVCVRGGPCPVSISTRKKCPACRFDKCLQKGMKLEAIREDRTRGGRSTYQCSYTLPNTILNPLLSPEQAVSQQQQQQQQSQPQQQQQQAQQQQQHLPNHHHSSQSGQAQRFGIHSITSTSVSQTTINGFITNNTPGVISSSHSIKNEQPDNTLHTILNSPSNKPPSVPTIPSLLQEIMDVEHLWQYNEAELARLNQPFPTSSSTTSTNNATSSSSSSSSSSNQVTNTLLVSAGLSSNSENANPDWIAHLCTVADHRLYKIVKWCKSLPLFKNISIDDQIRLLINSWCELLLFSCCFRSVDTPGEIKLSQGKTITLAQAKSSGLQACIERMLNLTEHLRRLRVDRYEYVAMKVIVLLQSDTELQEPVKVRECQEKALQSLQAYTHAHYPDTPSKFGELLLRIPDLQRTYQLGKEMLTIKSRDGGGTDFNLLMELLRGEH